MDRHDAEKEYRKTMVIGWVALAVTGGGLVYAVMSFIWMCGIIGPAEALCRVACELIIFPLLLAAVLGLLHLAKRFHED